MPEFLMDPEFTSHLSVCSLEDNFTLPEKVQEGVRNIGTIPYLFQEQETEGKVQFFLPSYNFRTS